jgi:radical SAM protein with 4Fe4S-binding SPASM domain
VSEFPTRRLKDCLDPWTGIVVGTNGDVTPCCHTLQRVGNLGEEGLDAIWEGPRARTFRAFLASASPLPVCSSCFVRGWRTEPAPPPPSPLPIGRRLLDVAGLGRPKPRLKVWADRAVHHPGEPLSVNLGLEAGRLQGGGLLDLYLWADDPSSTRHFVTFKGRWLAAGPETKPILSRMEPIDFEWLEVRAVPSREWTAGKWHFTAALTPADRGSVDRPHVLAMESCFVTEARAGGSPAPA